MQATRKFVLEKEVVMRQFSKEYGNSVCDFVEKPLSYTRSNEDLHWMAPNF